ncbi:MAG: FAD-binding oxidoreductase [Promethearchaeota archaeon]
MMNDNIIQNLTKICGSQNISQDPKDLKEYSEDLSFKKGKSPLCIVWPSNSQDITKIVKLANDLKYNIIPISSNSKFRHHGDTLPKKDNCIVLNLSRMNKVLSIDRKNRVVMVEPGVSFNQLIPILKKKGLRLLLPLHPTASRSILSTALEREPITIPRYHWDSSDPLLCTEVVFGTGDLFRTGTAAGPGTIKQQQKMGQAQVNPMGPTQFSPFRVLQGAQGSLGVVTWATLKLELVPSTQKIFHFQSENIQDILDFQYELLKYRLCDELVILNNLNLASLLKQNPQEISELVGTLRKWNLIYIISGRGPLAKERISYLEGDIEEIRAELGIKFSEPVVEISDKEILHFLNEPCEKPWRMRFKGAYQDIFFLTNFEKIPKFISLMDDIYKKDFGIYIQPINQGTSYHLEFDIYYEPESNNAVKTIKEKILEVGNQLIDNGAFFSRPYGIWAEDVFSHHSAETIDALKKVKKIFDPNNVLNPGVLCFDD